jgi:hypothetical protein
MLPRRPPVIFPHMGPAIIFCVIGDAQQGSARTAERHVKVLYCTFCSSPGAAIIDFVACLAAYTILH